MLHLVGSSILLYLTDDARSNKNQVYIYPFAFLCHFVQAKVLKLFLCLLKHRTTHKYGTATGVNLHSFLTLALYDKTHQLHIPAALWPRRQPPAPSVCHCKV